MKIAILGFSGSGKSTLAKKIAKHYDIKALHLDSLNFKPNWVVREKEEFESLVQDFINNNDNWVIEGNYSKIAKNRFELADIVIFLKYNRFTCLKGVISRYRKYKNRSREDMAEGCNEKLDFSFIYWVFHKGRNKKRKQKLLNIVNNAKEGYIFKNRKALNKYLISLGIEVE